MKKITFKDMRIYYGNEIIGSYRQAFSDRFIPEFIDNWEWVNYQFDFYEGQNGEEDFFKAKVIESISKVYNCFK